jgi:hypothetical protein
VQSPEVNSVGFRPVTVTRRYFYPGKVEGSSIFVKRGNLRPGQEEGVEPALLINFVIPNFHFAIPNSTLLFQISTLLFQICDKVDRTPCRSGASLE